MSWRNDAACKPTGEPNTAVFYPSPIYREAIAKLMCASCLVSEECLNYAMATEAANGGTYRHGVWGGLNAKERQDLSLVDERYAVHTGEPSLLEVLAITEEMEMMLIKFRKSADGFPAHVPIEMSEELAKTYIEGGYAVDITPQEEPDVDVDGSERELRGDADSPGEGDGDLRRDDRDAGSGRQRSDVRGGKRKPRVAPAKR